MRTDKHEESKHGAAGAGEVGGPGLPVGGRHHNDLRAVLESIHLRQHLVQGLVALIIPLGSSPGAPHCINLIDEDDCRCQAASLQKSTSHNTEVYSACWLVMQMRANTFDHWQKNIFLLGT